MEHGNGCGRYQFTRVFKAKRLDARARQRARTAGAGAGRAPWAQFMQPSASGRGLQTRGIYTQPGIKRAGQANVQYAVQRADFMKMHFIHAFAVYGCFAFGEQRNTLPGKCFWPCHQVNCVLLYR